MDRIISGVFISESNLTAYLKWIRFIIFMDRDIVPAFTYTVIGP